MLGNLNIPIEIFTRFNDVKFYDEPHEYWLNGQKLSSTTSVIKNYTEEFDSDYWSEYKAKELGKTKEEILLEWKIKNLRATTKGSIIHDYTENLFLNKIFPFPYERVEKDFPYDPPLIKSDFDITKKLVDDFYHTCIGKLIPIKTELVVYDEEFMLGGMIDMLFYNVKSGRFEIWDWKTNGKFDTESKYGNRYKGLLSHLDVCKLNDYSVQLSIYKYILNKYTSINIGDMYCVWFGLENEKFQIFKCVDLSEDIIPKILQEVFKS